MKVVSSKSCFLSILFGMFFLMVGNAQADGHYLPAKEHRNILSAKTIIQHNDRLLNNSTIGEALKFSAKSKARELYNKAEVLFNQASTAFIEGQEEKAKNLAYQSIEFVYQSDRAHYGL